MRLYDGERAAASFRRAIALSADSKEGWSGLSWTLRMLGRFDEADQCVKRLREMDPADFRTVRHVPSTGNQSQGTAEIERLVSLFDDQGGKAQDRVSAGFALGRLLDDAAASMRPSRAMRRPTPLRGRIGRRMATVSTPRPSRDRSIR